MPLFFLTIIFSWFLFNEYKFLKQQAKQLIDLQEDYRNYINALRRVFDSQKADNEVESIIEEKKKPFLVINREKKYLKESFLNFLKNKKIKSFSKNLEQFYANKHFSSEPDIVSFIPKTTNSKIIRKKNKRHLRKPVFNKDLHGIFSWPINNEEFWISSFFGLRKIKKGYSFHYGIDMAAIKGTIVKAAAAGKVISAAYSPGYGNTIVIKHDPKYKTRYAHLNTINVKNGSLVEKGQKIGTVGDTGSVRSYGKNKDASHLHFEVYSFDKQINPLYVLQ